jgi:hypothetical protein
MGFTFEFRPHPPPHGHVASVEFPSPDDDYFSVIVKACALLAEVEGAEFVVSGFGRVRWSLDVAYDMSAFLEATPDLAEGLTQLRDAEVEMYSQGVECTLEFRPSRHDVQVRCISATAWTPEPEVEHVPRSDLLEMIRRLQQDVAQGLSLLDPQLVEGPPFNDWLQMGRTLT